MFEKIPQSVREEQLRSLSGKRFVRWLDVYKSKDSKAVMQCVCGHEWSASIHNLLKGKGCPKCAGNYRYSAAEREAQIDALRGITFVEWVEEGRSNSFSKVVVECEERHRWSTSVDSLLNQQTGCPHCAGNLRRTPEQREAELNGLSGMIFVRWLDGYRRNASKAVMRCENGHEWSASINHLLRSKTGCPRCAKYGFDPCSSATLYALRSECGAHVKIGVTGHLQRRNSKLSRTTPFGFSTIALIQGSGYDIRDLERMFHRNFESSGFSGFDGATEWLKFDPQILSLLRILGA